MKKILTTLGLLSTLALFQTSANALGLFYTNATFPLTATGIQNEDIHNLKKGEASSINVLCLVEVGDAGIDEAMKKAGIKEISHIDVNEKTILFFFRKVTVSVYGK